MRREASILATDAGIATLGILNIEIIILQWEELRSYPGSRAYRGYA
jgi:hypothetical protein